MKEFDSISNMNFLLKKINLNKYTAVIKQDGNFWIGWIEEIPGVNCQEYTKEELIKSLKITLKEAIDFNKNEALNFAKRGFHKVQIAV